MYHKIETWLNNVLEQKIPSKVKAFCFNLYEDENESWSIELVGTKTFDLDDEDWACDEITDFWTRYRPFSWKEEADWNEVLSEVVSALKQYLENGLYADVLKSRAGVAVGFVDGNLEILYSNLSGVTEEGTMDKITMKENGEALDKDFVTVGTPHMPEAQDEVHTSKNEVSETEKSIAASRSKRFYSGSVKEICFIIVAVLFMAFGAIISSRDKEVSIGTPQQTDNFAEKSGELPAATEPTSEVVTEENGQVVSQSLGDTNADDGDAESAPEESEQNSWEYSNDETVPEVYREVLKQYREMIQANITDINSDFVQEKLKIGGEWEYVWDELYAVTDYGEICYSLRDLTGDGFPEMIMGIHLFYDDQSVDSVYNPFVIYYYSEDEGIDMIFPKTTWYDLALYEEGILELSKGDKVRVYTQYQKDAERWITVKIGTEYDNKSWEPIGYYKEEYNGESEPEHEIISEEEFFDIVEKYTAHPMQLEWVDIGVRRG